MFTRIGFLIGSFLVFQNSVFALVAGSSPRPSGNLFLPSDQARGVITPKWDQAYYMNYFGSRFIGILTLLVAMYILVSHYRGIKKSGLKFTRKDFFEIAGKLSLLFGLGYMALVLFDYVLSKYLFY